MDRQDAVAHAADDVAEKAVVGQDGLAGGGAVPARSGAGSAPAGGSWTMTMRHFDHFGAHGFSRRLDTPRPFAEGERFSSTAGWGKSYARTVEPLRYENAPEISWLQTLPGSEYNKNVIESHFRY
jgi:hypothetical protein